MNLVLMESMKALESDDPEQLAASVNQFLSQTASLFKNGAAGISVDANGQLSTGLSLPTVTQDNTICMTPTAGEEIISVLRKYS